ncbi:MAG: polysaccharide export protein [Bacteroidales bacterium]|nr:polysaccharide export protein [Bacteroidales bacterium]
MTRTLLHVLAAVVLLGAVSCSAVPKIAYMRDLQPGESLAVQEVRQLKLKPGDRLRIHVFSRDRELASLFNLYENNNGTGRNSYLPYTINGDGNIDMPICGIMHVAGLTRLELADQIKFRLLSAKLLNDPTVIVDYADMCFYALGELGRAGRIEIPRDQLTLLEAISLAGDLSIDGRRDNVLVLRTENGIQNSYLVDLTSTESIYSSPVYYIQQNDIIYVEPNVKRANQSELLANQVRTPGFWFSTVSSVASMVLLVLRLTDGH